MSLSGTIDENFEYQLYSESLISNLAVAMNDKKINKHELAIKANLPKSTLVRLLNNKYKPTGFSFYAVQALKALGYRFVISIEPIESDLPNDMDTDVLECAGNESESNEPELDDEDF